MFIENSDSCKWIAGDVAAGCQYGFDNKFEIPSCECLFVGTKGYLRKNERSVRDRNLFNTLTGKRTIMTTSQYVVRCANLGRSDLKSCRPHILPFSHNGESVPLF